MSAELAQHIATIAADGLQINVWPTADGYQANVKERAAPGWTCASDADPVVATLKALRSRAARHPARQVVAEAEPEQLDIEDAVKATGVDCAHGVPMHLTCGACEDGRTVPLLGPDAKPSDDGIMAELGL